MENDNVTAFLHVLPASRLGESHESLHAYRQAISPFKPTKSKHYTLIIVTSLQKHILLGLKQRGFGKNMYNSFGGKVEQDEDLDECASRELLEETGIDVSQEYMSKCHVGTLHYTFDDSDTEMIMHVFRVQVSTSRNDNDSDAQSHIYIHPSVIRPCDEIIPEWFDSYFAIPLHNMFADDSLWLTQLLTMPSDDKQMYMEGHFHFQAGGQQVNNIRHYHLSFKKKSLEQQLFHQLHVCRIHNPSIKEFKEAYAFAKVVQSFFRNDKFDVILDVAGGHGALAALLLILLPSAKEAVVIDPAVVGNSSVQRAWGRFFREKTLRYRHECLRTGLPDELQKYQGLNVLVVACHACQHLSEEVLNISCKDGACAAVMPCCQRDSSPGCSWKATSRNMAIPIAKTMDILLAGQVMGFRTSSDNAAMYDVRIKLIDEMITPQNRIILCRRRRKKDTVDDSASRLSDAAHAKLERAYRKAHERGHRRTTRGHVKQISEGTLCVKSLVIGMTIGVTICIILGRRH